jgi:hypothetical protein
MVGLRWRGGEVGRAAAVGLLAGLVPFVALLGSSCALPCSPGQCALAGVGSGVLGAVALGRALGSARLEVVAVGLGVAAATASMVCLVLGSPGLLVVPALVASAGPSLAWRRASS